MSYTATPFTVVELYTVVVPAETVFWSDVVAEVASLDCGCLGVVVEL